MEKFSNWRDKGTGISPFMPEEGVQLPMKKSLMNPLFIAVKLPALYTVSYTHLTLPTIYSV